MCRSCHTHSFNEIWTSRRLAKPSKSSDWLSRHPRLPWRSTTTMPLLPNCRISAPPERAARNSAASNSHPVTGDNNCRLTAAGIADTAAARHQSGRCCSPSTSPSTGTRRTSNRVRSDCGKAPRNGAYPPVRPGCSPRPCLCTRCRRCSWRDDAVCHRHRRSSSAAVEAAVAAARCCGRCCSYIGTGWRGCRCPKMTMVMPSRF